MAPEASCGFLEPSYPERNTQRLAVEDAMRAAGGEGGGVSEDRGGEAEANSDLN